jgi:hypothetical protein
LKFAFRKHKAPSLAKKVKQNQKQRKNLNQNSTFHLLISDRLVDSDRYFLLWGLLGLNQRPVDLKNSHDQAA